MCCRYYVESTPYFLELGEGAEEVFSRSSVSKGSMGRVRRVGEISPGLVVPVLTSSRSGKQIPFLMHWGFTAKNKSLIINARSESAAEKPMFRDAWAAHRCIIPASWYYEWEHIKQSDGSSRTADRYTLQPVGQDKAFLCGIYHLENGFPHFAVLTREAGDSIRFIHDRMPLILPEELTGDWIKPDSDPAEIAKYALTEMFFEKSVKDDPQISFRI